MSRLIRVQMTTAHPGITWKKRNLFAASAAIGILLLFGFVQRICAFAITYEDWIRATLGDLERILVGGRMALSQKK